MNLGATTSRVEMDCLWMIGDGSSQQTSLQMQHSLRNRGSDSLGAHL